MKFEWDHEKAAHNLAKHGIAFEEAQTAFDDDHFIVFADPIIPPVSLNGWLFFLPSRDQCIT